MANRDLVRRTQAAARRSSAASVGDQSRWHQEDLAEDLGIGPNAPVRRAPPPPMSFARVLIILMFVIVISGGGTVLWITSQNGMITAWIEARTSKPIKGKSAPPTFDLSQIKALGYGEGEAPPVEIEEAKPVAPVSPPRPVTSEDTVNADPFDSKDSATSANEQR